MILEVINLSEAKADEERLANFAGSEVAQKFMSLRSRLRAPENDLYYWIKQGDPKQLEDRLDRLERKVTRKQRDDDAREGAKLLYSDDTWKVYQIESYPASVKYGKNTKWCISGSQVWSNGQRSEEYFNKYRNKGVDFFFFIKNDGSKYALAMTSNSRYELYDAEDKSIKLIPDAPHVEGLPDVSVTLQFPGLDIHGVKLFIDDTHLVTAKEHREEISDTLQNSDVDTIIIKGSVPVVTSDVAYFVNDKIRTIVLESGIHSVGDSAFAYCSTVEDIHIPDTVTTIGKQAFQGCSSISRIIIPDSVTTVGSRCFSFCEALSSITLSEKLNDIPDQCFNKCSALETLNIPDSVTSVGKWAFSGCSSLRHIQLSNNLKTLSKACFSTLNIEDMKLPDTLDLVPDYCFASCTSLKSVKLPSGTKHIGMRAFMNCASLEDILLPETVVSISDEAFYGCQNMTHIRIPDATKSVSDTAFDNCSNLIIFNDRRPTLHIQTAV